MPITKIPKHIPPQTCGWRDVSNVIEADEADQRARLRRVAGKKPDPDYHKVSESSIPDVTCGRRATHIFGNRFYCGRHAKMLVVRQHKYDHHKSKEGGDETPCLKDLFWASSD